MPIYIYSCPTGHETEFLKLSSKEPEPKFCEHIQYYVAHYSGPCGLPLTKIIAPTNWKYTRGKNISWP